VIPRSHWGAQAPREAPDYGEVHLAFVHHTVTANDYSIEESASIVRGMQHYHRNVLGWDDIGYNLLVDRYGQVFEGRAGGIDQAVIGAQAQGYNSLSTGIAVIGTHTSLGITSAAFEALAAVLAWKLSLQGLPTDGEVTVTSTGGPLNRYRAGTPVRLFRISGHRDGDQTACPGEALYGQLPALRSRAGQLVGRFAQATGLAVKVSPRRVGYLEPTTVSGTLRQPDGSPAPGLAVDVRARSASGWSSVASAVTDPAGAWSTSLALPYTRSIRAVATLSGTLLTSATTRLEVRSAVAPMIRPVRMRLGRRTVLSGRVEPVKPRLRLVATIERRLRGGRYERVARLPVRARRGRFRLPLRLSRPGLYRIRLSVPGDRLNVRTRSDFVFARVRR
jgi:N-acetylmuramoyl-L-alanine amidase